MRKVLAIAFVPMDRSPAGAGRGQGVTTTSVNFRRDPGRTTRRSGRSRQDGVEIGKCEESGNWCAVTVEGGTASSAAVI